MMGGSVGPGNVTPAAEFNVYADPEAASVVFESGVPITMAGLDVGRESGVGPEEAERLGASGPFGEAVREIVASYARTYARATGRDRPPPLYDAVAVAALVEPRVMRTEPARVKVELAGELTLGETVCDLRGKWGEPPNAEVGVELDREAFFGFLCRCLQRTPVN